MRLDGDVTEPATRICVVVISKDEPQLASTLELLRPQCESSAANCVVIDASAGRLDSIRQAHPWVDWVDFSGPMGIRVTIPHQRNAGVRHANSDVIAFCDAGGSPEEGWLAALVAPVLAGRSDATCGPILPLVEGFMDPANDLADGAPIEIAITANMAFTRRAFDRAGGFDERYRYGSDTDFGFRLLDAGFTMTCAAGARMRMDWGDADRSVRRARSYGKGNVLLFLTHPKRARTVIRLWPDTIAYPLWIVVLVVLLPLATVAAWLPASWLALLAVPLVRNRRAPDLGALMRVKFERAVSFLTGWVTVPLHRDLPVVMVPENHENPYLDELCAALGDADVATVQLGVATTPSQTLNALIVLPQISWMRLRGARVLHIHWTYTFAWHWADRLPLLRLLPRLWFTGVLAYARWIGYRIVYTAHNLLPHHRVFDDDRAGRIALLARADEVIALTSAGKERLQDEFGLEDTKCTVIPEGVRLLHATTRGDRSPLRVVAYGHLDEYKGIDVLLDAALVLGSDSIEVELLGTSSDPEYGRTLRSGIEQLRAAGVSAEWTERTYTTDDLDALFDRAAVVALPFREITNSGSLLAALAHGIVCVVPELPALSDVPRAAVHWFAPGDPTDLARALRAALEMDAAAHAAMLDAATAWLGEWQWDRVALATRAVYERALA